MDEGLGSVRQVVEVDGADIANAYLREGWRLLRTFVRNRPCTRLGDDRNEYVEYVLAWFADLEYGAGIKECGHAAVASNAGVHLESSTPRHPFEKWQTRGRIRM